MSSSVNKSKSVNFTNEKEKDQNRRLVSANKKQNLHKNSNIRLSTTNLKFNRQENLLSSKNLSIFNLQENTGKLEDFIENKNSSKSEKSDIEFLFSIENNKNILLTAETLNNIADYRLEILENLNNNTENKLDCFLNSENNFEDLHDILTSRLNKYYNKKEKIISAIEEKTRKLKFSTFENKLKRHLFDNKKSDLFSNVTKYFIENNNKNHLKTKLEKNKNFEKENKENIFSRDINVEDLLRSNLTLINRESNEENFSTSIRTTSSDLVIQTAVNLSRSLYTLSTSCFKSNMLDEYDFVNFDNDAFKNIISEYNNFNVFKYINPKNNFFNKKLFIEENNIISYNPDFLESDIILEDSYNETNGFHYLKPTLNQFVNRSMFDKLKNVKIISNSNLTGDINYDVVYKTLEEVYSGDIFKCTIPDSTQKEGVFFRILNYATPENISANRNRQTSEVFAFQNYLNNTNITYFQNKPIINTQKSLTDSKLTLSSANNFEIDSQININELEYKISLDCLVKKNKISYLKNNNLNLSIFEEIIENINNSERSNIMLSYCKEDSESISIIDKESSLYNIMFTNNNENDNLVYGHLDLYTDYNIESINFKGIDSFKKDEAEVNQSREESANHFHDILSYYYPKNKFFSSSSLYANILESIIKESNEVENSNYDIDSLNQALYLNYIASENADIKIKKIIAKRFLKTSILNDTVSDNSLNNIDLDDFKYKIEEFNSEDYKSNSLQEIEKYMNDVLKSSQNLKKIKNTVFNTENINEVRKMSDFINIRNVKICEVKSESGIANVISQLSNVSEISDFYSLCGIVNQNILPNFNYLYNFRSIEPKNDLKLELKRSAKNKIKSDIEYGEINELTGEREITSERYYFDETDNNFDIVNSKNIKVKIEPVVCKSDLARKFFMTQNPYIVVEDKFKSACNKKNMVFHSICKTIQDLLRLKIVDYNSNFFSSEEEIDSFINSNEKITIEIINLISLYKEVYFLYFLRLQRENCIKIYNYLPDDILHGQPSNSINNPQLPYTGIISSHKNIYSSLKRVASLDVENPIFNKQDAKDLIQDIVKIHNNYKNNKNYYVNLSNEKSEIVSSIESFSTKDTNKLINIFSSLATSDFLQAFCFDIIKACISFQDNAISSNREDIVSSKIFDELKESLGEENTDILENNFYNPFYINNLSKNIFKNDIYNSAYKEKLNSLAIRESRSFYENIDIFEDIFSIKKQYLEKSKNGINLKNDIIVKNQSDLLNSNIYTFGLRNEVISKLKIDSLLKFKVSLIDKQNLNRIYLPKIFLFSPLFLDLSYIKNSDLISLGIDKNDFVDFLGYFNLNQNLENRLNIISTQTEKLNEESFIVQTIKNKTGLSKAESLEVYTHLLECHQVSNYLSNISKNIYELDYTDNNKKINKDLVELLINNLGVKSFFKIYDTKKDELISNLMLQIENNEYNIDKKMIENKEEMIVYFLLSSLEKIGKNSIFKKDEREFYDLYKIAIDPKNFIYIDSMINSGESESSYEVVEASELQKNLFDMSGISLEFIKNNTLKKPLLNIDNFDIIVETELV